MAPEEWLERAPRLPPADARARADRRRRRRHPQQQPAPPAGRDGRDAARARRDHAAHAAHAVAGAGDPARGPAPLARSPPSARTRRGRGAHVVRRRTSCTTASTSTAGRPGPGGDDLVVGRADRAGEGAAPGASTSPRARGPPAAAGRPDRATARTSSARSRRGSARRRRVRRPPDAARSWRSLVGASAVALVTPVLGRALRAGRGRGAGLRHTRAGLRAGRRCRSSSTPGVRRLVDAGRRRRAARPRSTRVAALTAAACARTRAHCSLDAMVDAYLELYDARSPRRAAA